ncbi:uncharacterized protein [Antedon mediterranea]|uniref:uncharacterized protein n=1 Tax=Antedon mediterranea TaxID=105859 RepID=UPI003AF51AFF
MDYIGTVIRVVIGSLISIVAAVAIILVIFKRFRHLFSKGNVGKSSTSQQNIGLSTVDTEYQNVSEKEREYESIQSTAATKSSAMYVYTKPEKEPEHAYVNRAEAVYTQPDSDLEPEPEHVYDVTKFENKIEYTNIKSKVAASSTEPVYADPEPEPDLVYDVTESKNEDYKPIELSELHGYVTKHQLKKEFETLRNLLPHPGEDLASQTRRQDISCQDTFHNVLFLTKRCFQLNPDVGSGADYVNAALIETNVSKILLKITL